MAALQNVVWLLVLIGVMILIHELGHFWAARYFDVKVDVFSFGFGPRIFGFRRGDTDYRLSAILFGGYVKMSGEQPGEESSDDPRGFLKKPRWQRLIIAAAGPFMNILLSVGLLAGMFMVKYQKVVETGGAVIGHVAKDSAAAKAGLQDGDKIVRIEGKTDPTWDDIIREEIASAGKPLAVTVERGGKQIPVLVTPILDDKLGVGIAGWEEQSEILVGNVSPGMPAQKAGLQKGDLLVSINNFPIRSRYTLQEVIKKTEGSPVSIDYLRNGQQQNVQLTPVYSKSDGRPRWMIGVEMELKLNVITTRLSLLPALEESVRQNVKSASLIYAFLRGMLERRMSAKSLEGPIGIAQRSGEAAREGPAAFLLLMTVVSLNLAIFNLLPIPILDGGVILLLLIEMIMRRDVSLQVKEGMLKVGFVFLMAVVVFVLYNDISKILPQG